MDAWNTKQFPFGARSIFRARLKLYVLRDFPGTEGQKAETEAWFRGWWDGRQHHQQKLTESDETLGEKTCVVLCFSWLMFFPPKFKIEEENHGFQKGFPFPEDLFSGSMSNFVGVCMLHVLWSDVARAWGMKHTGVTSFRRTVSVRSFRVSESPLGIG